MKKILIVDNNIDPPYGCAEIQGELKKAAAQLGITVDIESHRGPDSALPDSPRPYSAVVLSGSKTRIYENAPWIDREMNMLKTLHLEKIPSLGICYGEQLMARVFGGDDITGASVSPEYGWVELELTAEARLSKVFAGLPESFYSFGFHSDEVYRVPANFRVTAKNALCPVQAFELLDAPMWGVQFHPERGLEEGNRSLDRIRQRDPARKIFGREKGEKVYDPKIAAEIFRAFLKEAVGQGT